MKRSSVLAALLWVAFLPVACAQTLSLDQLIALRGKPAIEVDAYLAARGWRFSPRPAVDSIAASYWTHLGTKNDPGAVTYQQKAGQPLEVLYVTPSRAVFAAIQMRLIALNAKRGQSMTVDGELWTQYFTPHYEFWLRIFNPPDMPHTTYFQTGVQRRESVE